jgi:two-component system phosphate regulon sensor histidine kinase PhoR
MNETNVALLNIGSPGVLDHEQQVAVVFEKIATAILIFDSDSHLLFANFAGQKLFKDCEPKPGQKLPTASGYESLQQLLDKSTHSRTPFAGEIVWHDQRIFSAEVIPVPEDSYVVTLYDISRFKELEKLKNEFFATAIHDLRSPITAVIGFSHLMKATGSLNISQNDFVQRIQQAAINMSDLLENILYLTKFDLDPASDDDKVDISHLLFDIVDAFQPQATLKRQLLAFEKAETHTIIPGNESQLHQALRTLIGNAVKCTPEGGTITVSLEREVNMAKIEIKDTGYGIPASELSHIFDRFYRVHSSGHDEIEGSGLGLSIVKSIAEIHDGTVTVESEVGKGSCFTLNLPCLEFPPAGLKQEQETAQV